MQLLQEIVMCTIYLANLLSNEKPCNRHFKKCIQNKEHLQERFGSEHTYGDGNATKAFTVCKKRHSQMQVAQSFAYAHRCLGDFASSRQDERQIHFV